MIVTITDVRLAGHCVKGARAWFARHGLDFRAFVREGMPADVLLATGDALVAEVIARKKERERG